MSPLSQCMACSPPNTKRVLLQQSSVSKQCLDLHIPMFKERTCCLPMCRTELLIWLCLLQDYFSCSCSCSGLEPPPTKLARRELQDAEHSGFMIHLPHSEDYMGLYLAQLKFKHKTSPSNEPGTELWTWRGEHVQGIHRYLEKPGPCPRGWRMLAEGTADTDNISSYQRKI